MLLLRTGPEGADLLGGGPPLRGGGPLFMGSGPREDPRSRSHEPVIISAIFTCIFLKPELRQPKGAIITTT